MCTHLRSGVSVALTDLAVKRDGSRGTLKINCDVTSFQLYDQVMTSEGGYSLVRALKQEDKGQVTDDQNTMMSRVYYSMDTDDQEVMTSEVLLYDTATQVRW